MTSNATFTSNPFIEVFNDSKGLSRIGGSLDLLTDLRKIRVAVEEKTSNNGRDYDVVLFKGSIDACTFLKGVLGSAIVRMLKEDFTQHSNIPMENVCPFNKGSYYVKDFPMLDDKFIPLIILQLKRKWRLEITITAAESKTSKMAFVMKIFIFGTIS